MIRRLLTRAIYRRLLARAMRRRLLAPTVEPYAGTDLSDALLVDSAGARLLPCEGPCRAPITLHERTGAEATCRVCGTVRSATEGIHP